MPLPDADECFDASELRYRIVYVFDVPPKTAISMDELKDARRTLLDWPVCPVQHS